MQTIKFAAGKIVTGRIVPWSPSVRMRRYALIRLVLPVLAIVMLAAAPVLETARAQGVITGTAWLLLRNETRERIAVVLKNRDEDCPGDFWRVHGWKLIDPGETYRAVPLTNSDNYYYYAEQTGDDELVWSGDSPTYVEYGGDGGFWYCKPNNQLPDPPSSKYELVDMVELYVGPRNKGNDFFVTFGGDGSVRIGPEDGCYYNENGACVRDHRRPGAPAVRGEGAEPPTPRPEESPRADRRAVTIEGFAFAPQELIVGPGEVTWTNRDQVPHNLRFELLSEPSGAFELGPIGPGETLSQTWVRPGGKKFAYYCTFHPNMRGFLSITGSG